MASALEIEIKCKIQDLNVLPRKLRAAGYGAGTKQPQETNPLYHAPRQQTGGCPGERHPRTTGFLCPTRIGNKKHIGVYKYVGLTALSAPVSDINPDNVKADTMSTTVTPTKGLEGVVAASSSICYIDGDAGVLAYRGIDIHELAEKSTFEETCYLLWFGKLPTRAELADLNKKLAAERKLDPAIYDILRQAPKTALPIAVLRTALPP